jgi:hypothetical protein
MRIVLILSFVFVSALCYADLGSPSINAICYVTLKDGKKIEGMIKIVSGGYGGYCKNGFGFSFTDNPYFSYKLFNIDNFILTDRTRFGTERVDSKTNKRSSPELYYLSSIANDASSKQSFETTQSNLTITNHSERKYLVLKSFHIYTDFPSKDYPWIPDQKYELTISSTVTINSIVVKVDEIKEFTLITNPSDKWLKLIKQTRDNARLQPSEDYLEPLWYHEVIKDEVLNKSLSRILGQQYDVNVDMRDY